MSAINAAVDQLKSKVDEVVAQIKRRILGANNEQLDFVMDSFYKLNPSQRAAVLAASVAILSLFVIGAVSLYFVQVGGLKRELGDSFSALHDFQAQKTEYQREQRRFDGLAEQIGKKAADMRVKPFFEKLANEQGVQLEGGLNEQRVPLPPENPLSEKFQEVRVDFRLSNISIPRLLNFLAEVEKASGFVRIQDLKITGRYGTKLYFDAQVKARTYAVK